MNAGLRLSLIMAASHQHQVTSVLTGDTTQWSVSYIYITVNCILTLTALLNSTKSSDWPDVMCFVSVIWPLLNVMSDKLTNVWWCPLPPAQVVSSTLFTGNVRWCLPSLCSVQAAPPVTAALPKISGPGCLRPGPAAPGASAAAAGGHADIDRYSVAFILFIKAWTEPLNPLCQIYFLL